MSRKDYFTGKKALSGNKVSHAMNHSRRAWNVNLQTVKIQLPNGQIKKVKVSAKTLKTLNKKSIKGCKKAAFAKAQPKTEVVLEAKEVKVEPAKAEKPVKAKKATVKKDKEAK